MGGALTRCAFCDIFDPSESHLDAHRYTECAQKPPSTRTFYRKDHLRQHLVQFHGVDDLLGSMESWKSTITHLNCRCGFCGDKFEQWSARNEHLANHFCSGALMKDWEGCRGLDPAVAMLVRNAMPPYLIGTESKALIPFTAEKASTPAAAVGSVECEEAVSQSLRPVPTSFEILVAELSRYVNDQKRLCQVPTDEMLQRQARLIVYGDEDPWNQTAADSRQWLELFKMGHGIGGESQTSNACSGTLEPSSLEDDTAFQLPWYWQSPECLAEWKQSKAGFAAALGCDGRLDQTYIVSCDPASNDEMVYQNFATLDKNSALNLSEPITSATHDNLATTAHEMFTSSDINWLSCLPNDGELEDLFRLDPS